MPNVAEGHAAIERAGLVVPCQVGCRVLGSLGHSWLLILGHTAKERLVRRRLVWFRRKESGKELLALEGLADVKKQNFQADTGLQTNQQSKDI
eukprot:2574289-Amphidinium_carterae.1